MEYQRLTASPHPRIHGKAVRCLPPFRHIPFGDPKLPLESATYISDLVTSNPAASDGMNNADDHMRMIKAAVKNTFPQITGAVTATHTDLNNAAAFLAGTVSAKVPLGTVALPSYAFVGDLDTGMWSPGANQLSWSVGGVLALNIAADKTATFAGSVAALSLSGPGMCPIGAVLIWPSDTLPPASEGVFAWCNGATYSKTTYATCFARIGGSTSETMFAVPNYQEVALVGKSTMGGASSPGLLPSIASGVKTVLGSLMGANQFTILDTHLPPYTPAGTNSSGTFVSGSNNWATFLGGYGIQGGGTYPSFGQSGSGGYVTGSTSAPTFTGTPAAGRNSTPFDIIQPSRVVNFIIRLA